MDELMNDLSDIFEKAFSQEEAGVFKNIMPSGLDLDQLKKTGFVTSETFEDEGLIKTAVSYTSFDGKTSFTKTYSVYKIEQDYMELCLVNEFLENAVANEDYERAAELKQKRETLLAKLTK